MSKEDLLQGILIQISGLLGIVDTFMAILPMTKEDERKYAISEGFIAIIEEETDLVIRAKTGRFEENSSIVESIKKSDLNFVSV